MHDQILKHRAVVHCVHFGATVREVAMIYGVGKSTVARWVRQPLKGSTKAANMHATHRQNPLVLHIMKHCLAETPFVTAHSLQAAIHRRLGSAPSRSTIYRLLRKECTVSRKRGQRARTPAALVQNHPFFDHKDPYDGALSIDESHFEASDSPRYGWSRIGERVAIRKPNQYQRLSLLLAVNGDGVVGHQLVKGSVDSTVFLAFLSSLPSHRRIIVDNASIHKAKTVRAHCLRAGIDLAFTPPYCPWYNPVEYNFSKIKSTFRSLRISGNNFVHDVEAAVASLGDTAGCFEHARRIWSADKTRLGPL
jgi:transposase